VHVKLFLIAYDSDECCLALSTHQLLVHDSSKMPLYLKNGDISLHKGAKVITRVRMNSYVDERWLAKCNMEVLRPDHTCALCKLTAPEGVTFKNLALECKGTQSLRDELLNSVRSNEALGNLSVEDLVWMTATCQETIFKSQTADDIHHDLIVNATLLEIFKFARQIDVLMGKLMDRQKKWMQKLDERFTTKKRKRAEEK